MAPLALLVLHVGTACWFCLLELVELLVLLAAGSGFSSLLPSGSIIAFSSSVNETAPGVDPEPRGVSPGRRASFDVRAPLS